MDATIKNQRENDGVTYRVRLRLFKNGKAFYGLGVSQLLQHTDEKGSLRAAALAMNMAYSKAMRMIRTAEDALGYKLLESSIGGTRGGGSELTAQAKSLLQRYQAVEDELEVFSKELVGRYFKEEGF